MIRVLVVDDQRDVRFLIRVLLGEHADIEVTGEADGAAAAVEALAEAAPDVVVLDAVMPLVDGYDAAPLLREARPGLPIVLCTAHVDEVVHDRARAAGIERVIGKDELDRIPAVVRELAG